MTASQTTDLQSRCEQLRSLHRPGTPLLLPNAWDVATARAVAAAGFPVVATTSAGVAEALGYNDHEGAPGDEMLAAAARIARGVDVPVTVDAEAGYGLDPAELVAAFDGARISGNPARFDRRKAESINGVHLRMLSADDFAARLIDYLVARGDLPAEPSTEQTELVTAAAPLVQERSALLSEAATMIGFLLVANEDFAVEPAAAGKVLTAASRPVLEATIATIEGLPDFAAASLEPALKAALVDDLGLKPKLAFAPVRVAVTGRTISPPLYESLELVGRDATLARLRAALDLVGAASSA